MSAPETSEGFVAKGTARLFFRRHRPPRGGRPVILVHGSSLAAIPTFDLEVPGVAETAMARWLAARGRDCWIFDHHGYGRSTLAGAAGDVAEGVADLVAVTDHVRRETEAERVDLYGIAAGALRAACFAAAHADRVSALVLDAFVWTGRDSAKLAQRRAAVATMAARRPIDRAFVESVFAGEAADAIDPRIIDACAATQRTIGESAPTGTYRDMTTRLPMVEPERVAARCLMLRGATESLSTLADAAAFFARLPASDKQLSVLPGVIHCSPLGTHRRRAWRCLDAWLD